MGTVRPFRSSGQINKNNREVFIRIPTPGLSAGIVDPTGHRCSPDGLIAAEGVVVGVTTFRQSCGQPPWPDSRAERAYDAARAAQADRQELPIGRQSFISDSETVFSHRSEIDLANHATHLGYLVHLYVIMVRSIWRWLEWPTGCGAAATTYPTRRSRLDTSGCGS
jgi:hypothetical protein